VQVAHAPARRAERAPARDPLADERDAAWWIDRAAHGVILVGGLSAIACILAIFTFIFREAFAFIAGRFDPAELFGSIAWRPTSLVRPTFGALGLIVGTASVTGLAMLIAIPLSLAVAVYISEFAQGRTREVLKVTVELLAAVPSVVWGFIGLMIMNPLIIDVFDVPVGLGVLNSAILLALMAAPIMTTLAEDALKAVPDTYREAAEAMGATRWQVTLRVALPAAKNGLVAAALLGVGRGFGETMAVLMASGHAIVVPTSVFDSVRALTATIAAELGEAPEGSDHYRALFTLGVLLFVVTFVINFAADRLVRRSSRKR
jgi:phosphate transport system permease protein